MTPIIRNLVCLKLRIRKPYKKKQRCVLKGRRFDVTKLRTSVPGDSDGGEPLKLTFVTQVLEKAHAVWPVENDVDGQWSALRGALLESVENVPGYERSYQLGRPLAHYIRSFSIGISCIQPGWPLVRRRIVCVLDRQEEKLEGRSGRQKMPGLQPKQQILSVVVSVEWRCGVVLGICSTAEGG